MKVKTQNLQLLLIYLFLLLCGFLGPIKGFSADSISSSALKVKTSANNRTVNAERQKYLKQLNSVRDYKPQSKEEALYYTKLFKFLSQNKLAADLLYSSASLNTHEYNRIQQQLENNLLNHSATADLKFLGQLVKNNVDLKARVEIGGKIAGSGAGIELEVDLGGVAKDFTKNLIGDLTQNLMPETEKAKINYTARFSGPIHTMWYGACFYWA